MSQVSQVSQRPSLRNRNSAQRSGRRVAPDAAALFDFLVHEEPHTYGAAASRLGWGATRAWQAEARLRAAGLVRLDKLGRAELVGLCGRAANWQRR